jgi:hypothetical protein
MDAIEYPAVQSRGRQCATNFPWKKELRVIYPMFAMVVLTSLVLVTLFRSRVGAVRQGLVSAAYFRIYQGEVEPESTAKPARHFVNLFEAPVLFYVVCLAAMITQVTGIAMQALAWTYVAARIVHSYVHLGGNRLRRRMRAYFFSWFVLLVMWIYLVGAVALNRA